MPRIVLANGCFDPLHYGHVLHLRAARAMGDRLVVSVTCDEQVRAEKGDGRPVFTQTQRALMLKELRCVDEVIIVSSAVQALENVRPSVFVKGIDYRGRITQDVITCCDRLSTFISFTDTDKYSSSKLLELFPFGGKRTGWKVV